MISGNKKCQRKVSVSELEHNSPDVREWWLNILDILEKDIHMPPELSDTFLRQLLPHYLIDELQHVYKLHEQKFSDIPKEKSILCMDDKIALSETAESILDSEDVEIKITSFQKQLGLVPTVKPNPYTNFFKRRLDRAAIWREFSPLSISDMNLDQLAEVLAKNIATDFVTWFSSLGGNESPTVTVSNIIEMFEIGSQVSCATSLKVELRDMPCIPDDVAKATNMLHKSKRNMLFREILKDQKASKQKRLLVAFGKGLPEEMRKKPPPSNLYRKWLKCENIPESLETMAAVWQGITHLKSTKRFCEYINTNYPDLKPPKYLIDSGMMRVNEIASQKSLAVGSFGNVSRFSFVAE